MYQSLKSKPQNSESTHPSVPFSKANLSDNTIGKLKFCPHWLMVEKIISLINHFIDLMLLVTEEDISGKDFMNHWHDHSWSWNDRRGFRGTYRRGCNFLVILESNTDKSPTKHHHRSSRSVNEDKTHYFTCHQFGHYLAECSETDNVTARPLEELHFFTLPDAFISHLISPMVLITWPRGKIVKTWQTI